MSEEDGLELRKQFIELLQKLTVNETQENSFNKIKKLIKENTTNKSLRIFLNSLMTFNTDSITAKEKITILFGFLGNIYKSNLLDPLDNPKSIIKTINRIISHIRNNILKDKNYNIQKASSYSIIQILKNCMDKSDRENLNKIFIEPFILAIIHNSNIYIKNGCCIYLNDLILFIKDKSESSLLIFDILINQNNYINEIILKVNVNLFENEYLYESLFNLINNFPFKIFRKKLSNIINKLIQILNKKNNLKSTTIINCVNILNIIGKKTKKKDIKINPNPIIEVLLSYNNDKNNKIKELIRETLNIWDDMGKKKFLNNEEKENNEKKIFIQDIVNRTKKGKVEQFAQYDSEIVEKMKKDVYNNGIRNLINLSKFIQEHTRMKESDINDNFDNNTNNKISKLHERRLQRYNYKNLMPVENLNSNEFNLDFEKNKINNLHNNLTPFQINGVNNNMKLTKTEIDENENIIENMADNNNNNIFKFINISEIKNQYDFIEKNLLNFEKKIITKSHLTENKINKVKRLIENNLITIIQKHNNILDNTQIGNEIELYPLSLNFLNNNDYENAFANILGDDIYLIRLLIISRAHINELKVSKELFKKIIIRLNGINKSHFIENLIFESIQNIKPYIIINEQNYILGNDLINTMNDIKQYKNKNLQSKVNYFIKLIYNMYNNFNK